MFIKVTIISHIFLASIDALNHTILTIASPIQVNCYTRRVNPTTELAWLANGTPISGSSDMYKLESIPLSDGSYRNSLDIMGGFKTELVITCAIVVNGINRFESIALEG